MESTVTLKGLGVFSFGQQLLATSGGVYSDSQRDGDRKGRIKHQSDGLFFYIVLVEL